MRYREIPSLPASCRQDATNPLVSSVGRTDGRTNGECVSARSSAADKAKTRSSQPASRGQHVPAARRRCSCSSSSSGSGVAHGGHTADAGLAHARAHGRTATPALREPYAYEPWHSWSAAVAMASRDQPHVTYGGAVPTRPGNDGLTPGCRRAEDAAGEGGLISICPCKKAKKSCMPLTRRHVRVATRRGRVGNRPAATREQNRRAAVARTLVSCFLETSYCIYFQYATISIV